MNHFKLVLNSKLQTYQILTNDDQMLNMCLSYFITTVIALNTLIQCPMEILL
jgi:hypothetical protein